jgi:hypothetical protein
MSDLQAGQIAPSQRDAYIGERPIPYSGNVTGQPAAPMPPNKIRDIHISQLNHGYVINVGCSTFAIEKASDLIAKLSEYIHKPAETEQKWNDGKLF